MGKNGEASSFDHILKKLVLFGRVIHGREVKTLMVIIDSKSVKNADTTEEKGYGVGKNFGRKGCTSPLIPVACLKRFW
jgi:hypothetical protein